MSKKEMQKDDKKIFKKWLVIMGLAFILGFVAAELLVFNQEMIDSFLQMLENEKGILYIPLVVVFFLTTVLGYGYTFLKYRTAKRLVEEGYDDDSYDRAEEDLSKVSVATNVLSGFNYLLFGICLFSVGMGDNEVSKMQAISSVATLVIFSVATACNVMIQNKTVNLNKKMNPEKRGNVFDKKFVKEWVESCDEAEKALIYESAYSAYRIAISISTGMWAISLIGMMSFHTGVLPIIISSVMMIVLISTYSVTAYKLQYKK